MTSEDEVQRICDEQDQDAPADEGDQRTQNGGHKSPADWFDDRRPRCAAKRKKDTRQT
jgi:hypothetical protein